MFLLCHLVLCVKHQNNVGSELLLLCFFFFNHTQKTMNQEKLAKLQAQVRIGGKVGLLLSISFHSIGAITLINIKPPLLEMSTISLGFTMSFAQLLLILRSVRAFSNCQVFPPDLSIPFVGGWRAPSSVAPAALFTFIARSSVTR